MTDKLTDGTGTSASSLSDEVAIVYDGECPFCQQYTQLLRVRASAGKVRLIDARSDDPLVSTIVERGFNLDQGMIVIIAERFYHGAAAMQVLAMLSTRSGWFNRFNYFVFRSKTVSTVLYPFLRAGRNLVLRILGHKPIHTS